MTRNALILGGVLVLGGCAGDANHRLEIGTRRTATFADAGSGMAAASVQARSAWDVARDGSPIDGVVHGMTLRGERRVGRRAERWEVNAFPEVGRGRSAGGDGVMDAAGELGRSAGDLGLWAWRAARGERLWSPRLVWKRQPGDRARIGTVRASGGQDE